MALTGQEHLFLDSFSMVAYLCHHLSDNYVELSDFHVVLLENKSLKRVLAQLLPYR